MRLSWSSIIHNIQVMDERNARPYVVRISNELEHGNNYSSPLAPVQNLRLIAQGLAHQGANLGGKPENGIFNDRIQRTSEGCGFRR